MAYAVGRGPWTSRFMAIAFFNPVRWGERWLANLFARLSGRLPGGAPGRRRGRSDVATARRDLHRESPRRTPPFEGIAEATFRPPAPCLARVLRPDGVVFRCSDPLGHAQRGRELKGLALVSFVYTCRTVANAKLTAFRLTEADRAYLDTLEDKLGFSKTDVVRLALRRLAELEGLELIKKSDPRRPARRV
jgi:hypothetical protein